MRGRGLFVAFLLAVVTVACGDSVEPEPRVDAEASGAEPSPTDSPGFGYAGYKFTEFDPKGCYKKMKLGDKTSVKLGVDSLTSASPFKPNCLTDVKSDHVKVTLVSDNTAHNMIVEDDDVEIIVGPGETASATFELADKPIVYFACTYHPSMIGAFFR